MSDKTCYRCRRPIPPGPVSFIPGPPGEGGWACPPRLRADCEAASAAPVPRFEPIGFAGAAGVRAVCDPDGYCRDGHRCGRLDLGIQEHVERLVLADAARREAEVVAVVAFMAFVTGVPARQIIADRVAELAERARPPVAVIAGDDADPPLDDPIEPDYWSCP